MKLRKSELTTLAELLVAGADTPETLAQAFVDEYERLIGERSLHYGVLTLAGVGKVLGPYSTVGQARKAIEKHGGEKGWAVPGHTEAGLARHMAEVDREPEPLKLSAKEQARQEKGFWPRAHAIREGEAFGIVAEKGGVQILRVPKDGFA